MLILNKENYILKAVILAILVFLFLDHPAQAAISTKVKQAKVKNNPTVYFLQHNIHRKKAYLSGDTYLSYGNKWSDIKIVNANDLNLWPEIKLVKTKNAPGVYYLNGSRKTLILSWSDLENFGLSREPIMEINETDLNQYQAASYEEAGLAPASNLLIFNDLVTNPNNALITNTDGNLAGIFRFRSPSETATVTSLTLSLTGVYSSNILSSAFLQDENNSTYGTNISLNTNDRQIYVHFREPLVIAPDQGKTIKVLLNFKTCPCNNQSIRLELKKASDINSSRPVEAVFPIQGTSFKLLSGDQILGRLRTQEQSLSGSNLAINNGSRLIGKFRLYEDSGLEDINVKTLTFTNNGSAGENDWEDFRLLKDGQVIARTSTVSENGNIMFSINYLRITHDSPTELTIVAGLKTGYNPQNTFDLQLSGLWAVGKVYNLSLQPQLDNISETFTLN